MLWVGVCQTNKNTLNGNLCKKEEKNESDKAMVECQQGQIIRISNSSQVEICY